VVRTGTTTEVVRVAEAVAEITELSPRSGRVRRKKLPRHTYDRRSRLARRISTLAKTYRARLGEAASDPVIAAAIARAAETVALSEDMRARMLRGEAVSPDDVLRMTRTADFLTRKLLAKVERATLDHSGPSLDDIMAEGNEGAP
jgi:hypothetical protein